MVFFQQLQFLIVFCLPGALNYAQNNALIKPLLLQWVNGTQLKNHHHQLYSMCTTHNICIIVVDSNTFANFMEISFKVVLHLDVNLSAKL